MKTYTQAFMQDNCGCYSIDKLEDTLMKGKTKITDIEIIESEIPLKDKFWFFCKKIFSKQQNQQIAIRCAEIVLPIYEARYPENKAPREAIEAAKLFLSGHITINELLLKRRAAAAAYAAAAYAAAAAAYAAAAYAAAAAAYAAAAYAAADDDAADDDADDDAADDDAAYAAADDAAAYAVAALKNLLIEFVNQ